MLRINRPSRCAHPLSLNAARLAPLVLLAAATGGSALAGPSFPDFTWHDAVDGLWTDGSRWDMPIRGAAYPGEIPDSVGVYAVIGAVGEANYTVTIDALIGECYAIVESPNATLTTVTGGTSPTEVTVYDGSFVLDGGVSPNSIQIFAPGSFNARSETIVANLDSAGTVRFEPGISFDGLFVNTGYAEIAPLPPSPPPPPPLAGVVNGTILSGLIINEGSTPGPVSGAGDPGTFLVASSAILNSGQFVNRGDLTLVPDHFLLIGDLFAPVSRGIPFFIQEAGGTLNLGGTLAIGEASFFVHRGGDINGEVLIFGGLSLDGGDTGTFRFVGDNGIIGDSGGDGVAPAQRIIVDARFFGDATVDWSGFLDNFGTIDLIPAGGVASLTGFDSLRNFGVLRTLETEPDSPAAARGGGVAVLGFESVFNGGTLDIAIDTLIDTPMGIGFFSAGEIILRGEVAAPLTREFGLTTLTINSQGFDATVSIRGNGVIRSENTSGRPHVQVGPISPGFDEPDSEAGTIFFEGPPELLFTTEKVDGAPFVADYICDIGVTPSPFGPNDFLAVGGGVRFDGARLTLRLPPGFVPGPADRFTIMSWLNHDGEFSEVLMQGSAPGWSFSLEYSDNFLEAVAPSACPGDATGDNIVNFADITDVLTYWLSTYNHPFGRGDANHNGEVNFDDITEVLTFFDTTCE